jgi:hypothetical protein
MKDLFIDIETAPYHGLIWRCGGKQFVHHDMLLDYHRDGNIICACYKWAHEKVVHSVEWNANGDKRLLEDLLPVLMEADHIIAQNGDRFDIPYLNTRILMNGLGPVPEWKTVDTLVIARRRFRFPSNRLDAMGKFCLGEGKIRTDIEWWTNITERDDPKAMRKMVRYCKKDVRLLEAQYKLMAPFHKPKSHVGVSLGRPKWTCMHCGSKKVYKNKTRYTTAGTTQHQMQCNKCGRYYTISDSSFADYLKREAK